MKVLQRLTLANLRQNRRRSIVTIVGVVLSAALILAVAGMVTNFQKMMINYTIAEKGDFHEMFQEVPIATLEYVERNPHVESYYYSAPLGADDVDEETFEIYETYQHAPYQAEYYERLERLPDHAEGTYNIYVRYDNPKAYEANREAIIAAIASATGQTVNYRTNDELLRYEIFVMGDAALATLYSMAAIVIGIIVVTSVFVIRNSFSISATERARQFGMLASIGATPRQIRHSILFEGFVIGLIGIPLGILLGMLAVAILVMIVNVLLEGIMTTAVEFSMPLWIFPVAIILSFVTVFLSSLLPAIRTARIAPIEAIRSNQDIKVKAKKLRSSKLVKQLFGIGGVIADKNLKRSRKKYRTTVVSIVLSVATFIGLYSFINYGQDIAGLKFSNSPVDFVMYGGDEQLYRDLITRFDLKNVAYYRQHATAQEIPIYAMDRDSFAKFAQSMGVRNQDLSQVVLMNDYTLSKKASGGYVKERLTDLKSGDQYHGTTITKVIDQTPLGLDSKQTPFILMSEDYTHLDGLALDGTYGMTLFVAGVDDVPAITSYLDEYLSEHPSKQDYYYEDVKEAIDTMRRMYILISIFLYGFVIVVTLIGVTNIFNTISTNIALRAKEFATLKSIGMTSREFNRMIRLESLMYAGKALLIGIPLGLLLSYVFYQSIANSVDFGWFIPWTAIIISALAVGLLISVIMHYSVRQVSKQNIIETIRTENI